MLSWEKTVTETPNVFVDNLGILQIPHEGGGGNSLLYFISNEPKAGLAESWEAAALWFPRSSLLVCTCCCLNWTPGVGTGPFNLLTSSQREGRNVKTTMGACLFPAVVLAACNSCWLNGLALLCDVPHPTPLAVNSNQGVWELRVPFVFYKFYFMYVSICCSVNGTKSGKFREQRGTRKWSFGALLSI